MAAYRAAAGLDLDPATRAALEEGLARGQGLMDRGRLADALPEFEAVTGKTTFRSELHGRAALQLALCLDSLGRNEAARPLYEKLASHPDAAVRKAAARFLFGFKAMEDLKVRGGEAWDGLGYRRFFDSFSTGGYNTLYHAPEGERSPVTAAIGGGGLWSQALPALAVLLFPLILVVALVLQRRGGA
eukprot:SM000207S06178  [mRNA]  locus=s207:92471:93610:+ [translate_table: standard]